MTRRRAAAALLASLLLSGCLSVQQDPVSDVERDVERTKVHTFDLTTPPSREQMGLLPGAFGVDYNCHLECRDYTFTLLLPGGRTLELQVASLRAHEEITGDGRRGDLPVIAVTLEVVLPRDQAEVFLRSVQEPLGVPESRIPELVTLVREGLDPAEGDMLFANDLQCLDYLQPGLGFFSWSTPDKVRFAVELDWGRGWCGVPRP